MQGLVRTCVEMCAVDLTEVYSPALFNERSMLLGLSTEGSCRPADGLDFGDQSTTRQMQQRAAKHKTEVLDRKSTVPMVPDITESRRWELSVPTGVERKESHHNTIASHICCAW